ncbi:MAG: PfkB family carbohydrate kinase [Acidobacteriota bacterium]|jgi:sugar/nucleoside kinase (ribokinase family)
MNLLVVGTVAYDSVKTPFGEEASVLGGSATYFSVAASYFTEVGVLAVVGEDFKREDLATFEKHHIDTSGLETALGGTTFHWEGEYGYDLNDPKTLKTDLNVLAEFNPRLPEACRDVPYLFLANIDPRVQLQVLDQVKAPHLVAADTMNYWIEGNREDLLKVLRRIDILTINESEARLLAQEFNLVKAARRIISWGPRTVIIKRGEYGVLEISENSIFAMPAYPLDSVRDPTGAGDSFAGGFMGFLANGHGLEPPQSVRQAILAGSVMASLNVQDFSLRRLSALTQDDIRERHRAFQQLTVVESLD